MEQSSLGQGSELQQKDVPAWTLSPDQLPCLGIQRAQHWSSEARQPRLLHWGLLSQNKLKPVPILGLPEENTEEENVVVVVDKETETVQLFL